MKTLIAYPSCHNSYIDLLPNVEIYSPGINIDDYNLIVFTGGEDINPRIYGQKNTFSSYSDRRDYIELSVLKMAIGLNKKILGSCRGHQLINAFLGGELIQDLSLVNSHHGGGHILVYNEGESIIKKFFSNVNSIHHQGVIKPGKGLIPTSYYQDIIESTEGENIITTQFHPEWMHNNGDFFKFITGWASC